MWRAAASRRSSAAGEQGLDFPGELAMAHRLEQQPAVMHRVALCRSSRVAGGEEHLDSRMHLLRLARQLHAVEPGHHDIGEQQVDGIGGEVA